VQSRRPKKTGGRWLLLAWLVAVFAISAVQSPWILCAMWGVAVALFGRGLARQLRRAALAVLPVVGGLCAMSYLWRVLGGQGTFGLAGFATLALRAMLIAFVSFSTLARLDLLRALDGWPTLTRLLVITLAQIHGLRLLVTQSWLGLKSRLPRKARTRDVLTGAGGLTATLIMLSTRNSRDITDALRSRTP
jgi:cobalt/nickel transport system permease protein